MKLTRITIETPSSNGTWAIAGAIPLNEQQALDVAYYGGMRQGWSS